ncbi:MAG: hypothetical protein ABIJ52_00430 [Pseudomonadota bacterium]
MVTIKFNFFVWETISAFRAIQRYFELIESQIEKVKDEEWQKLKELPAPIDEEEYQTEYLPTVGAHKHEFEKLLPRIVGYSFVMMLFSELEFRLNEVTREINKRDNVPQKISDFNGDLVEKFCKFLKASGKPQIDIAEKTEINDFKVVRNCIVHNNGFLNNFRKSEQVRKIARNKLHIEIIGKPASERIQSLLGTSINK